MGMEERKSESARIGPGLAFNKYDLLESLGIGGSGEVWKAWDRDLKRFVAIKFIRSTQEEHGRRLLREAETAAKLDHPGIVPIYDAGVDGSTYFVVMKFIEGQTLDRAVLDLREKVAAVRDAARALDYAHTQGVIHRDVKPQNIIAEHSGPGGAIKVFVADFGLAKQHQVDTSISVSGAIIGTAQYMSPEQAQGRAKHVDARSDVYSLGATLYELVSGKPPFDGESFFTVVMSVIQDEPAPLRKLNPSLPVDMSTIILKALEKNPDRRYPTARDMADDLDRWLQGEPIQARPISWLTKFVRRVRRPALLWPIAGVVTFLVLGGGLYWKWRSDVEVEKKSQYDDLKAAVIKAGTVPNDFKPGPGLERIIDKQLKFLEEALQKDPDHPHSRWYRGIWLMVRGEYKTGMRQDPRDDLSAAIREFDWVREQGLTIDSTVTSPSNIYFHRGLAHYWLAAYALSRLRRGEDAFASTVAAGEQGLADFLRTPLTGWPHHMRIGQTYLALAEAWIRKGDAEKGADNLRQAAPHLEPVIQELDKPGVMEVWGGEARVTLARRHLLSAQIGDKEKEAASALSILDRLRPAAPQDQAEKFLLRALGVWLQGDTARARELARSAFTLFPAWEPEWPQFK